MKNTQVILLSSFVALSLGACTQKSSPDTQTPFEASSESAKEPAVSGESPANQAAKEAPPKPAAELVYEVDGFSKPEAILYDPEQDVYFVSNVNGDPLASDHNGFISKVSPEGKVIELKFIDGTDAKTSLDAPKGMAIVGDLLYVSDITWVRIFDRKTGAPRGKLFAKGATFLNDLTVDNNGVVYVSDTGFKSGEQGFAKSGSDTVYRIDPKKVATEALIRDKELGNPNGLVANADGLWAVNAQGELFRVSSDGKKETSTKLAKGGLDGVVALEDGTFLISSWDGAGIYRGKPGGEFVKIVAALKSPADIGFDSKRELLLIPSMNEDRLLAYKLSAGEGLAPAQAPAPGSAETGAPTGAKESPAAAAAGAPAAALPAGDNGSAAGAKPAASTAGAKKGAPGASPSQATSPAAAGSKTPENSPKANTEAKPATKSASHGEAAAQPSAPSPGAPKAVETTAKAGETAPKAAKPAPKGTAPAAAKTK